MYTRVNLAAGGGNPLQSCAPVNERGGGLARQELGMPQDILQEQNVCLHAPDVEFVQRSLHLLDCVQVCVASADDLYDAEKRVSSI